MLKEILARLSVGFKVGVVLTGVAILLHIVGFSTTYWYVGPLSGDYDLDDGKEHYGLWEACFELNWGYYTCMKFSVDLEIGPTPTDRNKGMRLFIH